MKEEFSWKFEMKDLGNLHFFLGMEVETGSWLMSSLHQPNWVFQKHSQAFSRGGLQKHQSAIWSKNKVKKEYEPKCWNGEGSLSTSRWILDVCHVYLAGLGIPNKHGVHMANLSLKH